ncbi:MAG: hypothetical protein FWD49_00185 [Firmicutes bacterium]|nr:hypothetical protein [Bacillota bacterium]
MFIFVISTESLMKTASPCEDANKFAYEVVRLSFTCEELLRNMAECLI